MRVAFTLVLTLAISAGGCTPAASHGGFDSPNPASKLYAIRRAGDARDRGSVPNLVEQLESDDPAVRMMTIGALQRITGTRMGYNPYGSVIDRSAAIDRWVQAVRTGKFTAGPK